MNGSIIVVDDDKDLLSAAEDWLSVCGYEIKLASSAIKAEQILQSFTPDAILTDIRMPGKDGMMLLDHITRYYPEIPVIVLTGHGDVALAVKAMQMGAYDFLEKPYNADHLASVIARAVEKGKMTRELHRLRKLVGKTGDITHKLIGASQMMVELRTKIESIASIDVDVLVRGETGTGKELVARALHEFGSRSSGNFVAINCAAIPETVFESELFGHIKGAFTGAQGDKPGKLEYAKGGTVFLDEIESMPLFLQAKMLRVIQERVVDRLGENFSRPIDVRFIAAVKVDLKEHSEKGHFRKDLFYRLSTAELQIPMLKDRGDDVELLFRIFVDEAEKRYNKSSSEIPHSVFRYLREYDWPGNVRELKSYAERFVLGLVKMPTAGPSDLPHLSSHDSLTDRIAHFEAAEISKALDDTSFNTAKAAEILKISRRTLNEKIAKYGLRKAKKTLAGEDSLSG